VAVYKHLKKYVQLFEKEMAEVDPLQQVVLKGHLIIEAALDNIISIIFFHPQHVLNGRFTFLHKVQLARAYGLRKDTNTIWNLIYQSTLFETRWHTTLQATNVTQSSKSFTVFSWPKRVLR